VIFGLSTRANGHRCLDFHLPAFATLPQWNGLTYSDAASTLYRRTNSRSLYMLLCKFHRPSVASSNVVTNILKPDGGYRDVEVHVQMQHHCTVRQTLVIDEYAFSTYKGNVSSQCVRLETAVTQCSLRVRLLWLGPLWPSASLLPVQQMLLSTLSSILPTLLVL
jgi:hypothetical protein